MPGPFAIVVLLPDSKDDPARIDFASREFESLEVMKELDEN